jgi:hypothetical protein
MAAERAKALLAGRALNDVWAAWLCLAQGFVALGATGLAVTLGQTSVIWKVDFSMPVDLDDLLRQERFLLGWLNLGWFGRPAWSAVDGMLTVEWRGNLWQRYRISSALRKYIERTLAYAPVPVTVGTQRDPGRSLLLGRKSLPSNVPLCIYPLPGCRPGGLDVGPIGSGSHDKRRYFSLETLGPAWTEPAGPRLAAYASKSTTSWSWVSWVHWGALVCQERNTLERPGVDVVASLEALGLETDLAGFSVVTNEQYYRFINQLKKDVLWML